MLLYRVSTASTRGRPTTNQPFAFGTFHANWQVDHVPYEWFNVPRRDDRVHWQPERSVIRGAHTLGIVNDRRWGAGIRALPAGGRPDPTAGARAVPVCQTTSFLFGDNRSEAFAAAMRAAAKAFRHTGAVRGFVFGAAARNLSQVV